jgi:hypothetical protein
MRNKNKIINLISLFTCALILLCFINTTYASKVIGNVVSPNSQGLSTSAYAGSGYLGGTNYVFSYNELSGKYTATKLFNGNIISCKGWEMINADGFDNWYYFDINTGELKTGWFIFNNETFYAYAVDDGNIGKVYAGWHEIEGMVYYFNEETCILEQTYTMEQAKMLKIITPEETARENLQAMIDMNSNKGKRQESSNVKTKPKTETETKATKKETASSKVEKKTETEKTYKEKIEKEVASIRESETAKETRIDPSEYKQEETQIKSTISFDTVLTYIKNILDWIVNLFK